MYIEMGHALLKIESLASRTKYIIDLQSTL
jgi:hypothetical protein